MGADDVGGQRGLPAFAYTQRLPLHTGELGAHALLLPLGEVTVTASPGESCGG
jgi:hypothetical protein